MKSFLKYISAATVTLSFTCLYAEDVGTSQEISFPSGFETPAPKKPVEVAFSTFTGKVKGNKVRLRIQPDIESYVIQELQKDDLFLVVGDSGSFWAVEPPENVKAYVFSGFIFDGVVEGNRVNVRLEPDLEAPVIGHLQTGDKVHGAPSEINKKWYEITPPANTRFYIAKEYVDKVGGADFKAQYVKKQKTVDQLLESTNLLAKAELQKSYEHMDVERLQHTYNSIIQDYHDFPSYVEKAKEALTSLQDAYLQKKIAFLESKASKAPQESKKEQAKAAEEEVISLNDSEIGSLDRITDRMKIWEPVEEALFLSSAYLNHQKDIREFYEEQKQSAVTLTGIVEPYNGPIKGKPGSFILRSDDLPVAYIYSTLVNLDSYVGKRVSIVGSSRDNNNFAFPAYFVLSLEQ
jgi:hypothetical protein